MAGLGSFATWRHVVVGAVVVAGPVLALAGCLGEPYEPEGFDAKQIVVTPEGADGVRIREVVDQDFGTFGSHGYERSIPNDFGVPTDVEATSPDAPADVTWCPTPARSTGDAHPHRRPGRHGQRAAPLRADLHAARRPAVERQLFLDIIDPGEPFATDDFEVVVTGLDARRPAVRRGDAGAAGGCSSSPTATRYRAELGPLDAGEGVTISGGIVAALRGAARRRAAAARPRASEGSTRAARPRRCCRSARPAPAAVFAVARRRGRNEVYAGGAADAAFGGAHLPPPGSPPLAVTYVADDRMGDLATTEFEPPRGIAPWQGQVLLRERIDADTVERVVLRPRRTRRAHAHQGRRRARRRRQGPAVRPGRRRRPRRPAAAVRRRRHASCSTATTRTSPPRGARRRPRCAVEIAASGLVEAALARRPQRASARSPSAASASLGMVVLVLVAVGLSFFIGAVGAHPLRHRRAGRRPPC